MFSHVEIVHMYLTFYSIPKSGEACKDIMCVGKTPQSVSLHRVWLVTVWSIRSLPLRSVSSARSYLISRIFLRKRIFQQNHFSLFIRGPGGFDSRKNANKSRDTAALTGTDAGKKPGSGIATLSGGPCYLGAGWDAPIKVESSVSIELAAGAGLLLPGHQGRLLTLLHQQSEGPVHEPYSKRFKVPNNLNVIQSY